ncbi:MAG: erythromycin esterase family protein [Thermoanaerobaculia bacterium]|nr:erythromycin esterase family protein [Thermoanaerobaculia bacterium]
MLRRSLAALGLAALALATPPLAASDAARVAWLREHAVPLATLDPAAPLDDLDFLAERLAGVRVVLLGEATRGDGSALLAKTRLVRYLYERLGYDLLAFECGFYDCGRAWRELRAGADARQAFAGALFALYTEAVEMQPLLGAVAASAGAARPLELAGIDPQGSAETTGRHLLADLRAALGGDAIDPGAAAALARIAPGLRELADEAYATGAAAVPAEAERRAFRDALAALRGALATRGGEQLAWWTQVLVNVEAWAEGSWRLGRWQRGMTQDPALFNLRDRQMAENLRWLAARHPERKIVVWSLTVHAARNLGDLDASDSAVRARLGRMSALGDAIAESFGDAAYAIGVTAAVGRNATPYRAAVELLPPSRGSFEELMTRAGFGAAFVDLRRPGRGGDWLRRPLVAKPVTYVELLGRWPQHLDGLLFVREMQPAHRVAPASPSP